MPQILIDTPQSGSSAYLNERVQVHSIASDEQGITRVDLLENDILVRSDETPDGVPQTQFSLLQTWTPDRVGDAVLTVIAYRWDGTPSPQAKIVVHVAAGEMIPATGAEEPQDCIATALTTLNVRRGPGVVYEIDGSLLLGQLARVTGKNANGLWWQIDFNGGPGWVSAPHTLWEGACDEISEAAAPPPPAGATPVYRTPVPVFQANMAPSAQPTGITEVSGVDVWVRIWLEFLGLAPSEPSATAGIPSPTPQGTHAPATTQPKGVPPPVSTEETPEGSLPPATTQPGAYPPPQNTQPEGPPSATNRPTTVVPGYPPPATTQPVITTGAPAYPPPEPGYPIATTPPAGYPPPATQSNGYPPPAYPPPQGYPPAATTEPLG